MESYHRITKLAIPLQVSPVLNYAFRQFCSKSKRGNHSLCGCASKVIPKNSPKWYNKSPLSMASSFLHIIIKRPEIPRAFVLLFETAAVIYFVIEPIFMHIIAKLAIPAMVSPVVDNHQSLVFSDASSASVGIGIGIFARFGNDMWRISSKILLKLIFFNFLIIALKDKFLKVCAHFSDFFKVISSCFLILTGEASASLAFVTINQAV